MYSSKEIKELGVLPLNELTPLLKKSLTQRANPPLDTCSIINAKSGHCSEDCHFCSQSSYNSTPIDSYDFLSDNNIMSVAKDYNSVGIKRFSLVTSGRGATGEDIDKLTHLYRRLKSETTLYRCGSLGLLSKDNALLLKEAGLQRLHNNLETGPAFFPKICTTHTIDDKIKALAMYKELGFSTCSGGILGLGESLNDRLEMLETLLELKVDSICINLLVSHPGTGYEGNARLSFEQLIHTLTLYRIIVPPQGPTLRFTGGRQQLSLEEEERALKIGIDAVMLGDFLTCKNFEIEQDKQKMRNWGFTFR